MAARAQKIITQDLLRRRAEHNDGELSTLREVTLHQFDIEKIENLDVFCRHLEILYLQNNQISKIENLHKLKELQYLNLALNNITKIENLERCESLAKLDLTVNFVSDPLDLESLKGNIMLRDLFLVGNPVTQVSGYREFAIVTLPQLKVLDGKDIEKSERILAQQAYASIRQRLIQEREERIESESSSHAVAIQDSAVEDIEKVKSEFKTKPVAFTPETRKQTAREIEAMNPARDDPSKPKPLPAANTTISYGPDGRVLQKNEGKWSFLVSSNQNAFFLDVEVSKFLDSSFINVRVEARFIQIVIKNKVLTVSLDEDVVPEAVICERSTLSGNLVVSMLKASAPDGTDIEEVVRKHKSRHADKKGDAEEGNVEVARNRRKERLFGKNYTDKNEREGSEDSMGLKIFDSKFALNMDENPSEAGFVDDPDVPPLC
ncbi:hypothetical protein BJ741DRAFT_215131 [Chytriomyces cf. hyalinus JEL632]|nr:hypothetical protein BJ741DRAFT_215131 [Chytriomyces cf. hyalinus JEL632]